MKTPWRRHALPRRPADHIDYWASVEVLLYEPIPVDGEDDEASAPVVGYIRNFGIRSPKGEIRSMLERAVDDGEIQWETTEWYPVDPDNLDPIVRERIVAVNPGGIWYVSGRAFYPDDSDHEPTPIH
jgi:hypothetical protein